MLGNTFPNHLDRLPEREYRSRISPVLHGQPPGPNVRVAESRKAFGSGALRVHTFTA
jgi:hypothetical protein